MNIVERSYTFVIHLINGDMKPYKFIAETDLDAFKLFCMNEKVQSLSHDEVSHTEFFSVQLDNDVLPNWEIK